MYADLRGRFGTRSDESATRLQAEIARCISAIGDEQQPGAAGGSSPDEANTALMFRTFSAAANRIKAENEKLKEARLCPSCSPEWRNSDSLLVESVSLARSHRGVLFGGIRGNDERGWRHSGSL
jgi:hypothetical protein